MTGQMWAGATIGFIIGIIVGDIVSRHDMQKREEAIRQAAFNEFQNELEEKAEKKKFSWEKDGNK